MAIESLRQPDTQIAQAPQDNSGIILAEGIPARPTHSPSIENTREFFGALSFSTKDIPYPFVYKASGYETREQWAKSWEMLGKHLGTSAYLSELSDGIGRESARQIVKRLVKKSHASSPEELRESYPEHTLSVSKLYESMDRKVKEIDSRNRTRIEDALQTGLNSSEIKQEFGMTSQQIAQLRKKGVVIPYQNEAIKQEYRQRLSQLAEGELNDAQILDLFRDIEENNRIGICVRLQREGVVSPLSTYARDEGVYIGIREYADVYKYLKSIDIPIIQVKKTVKAGEVDKQLNYYYVLNNHPGTKEVFSQEQPRPKSAAKYNK